MHVSPQALARALATSLVLILLIPSSGSPDELELARAGPRVTRAVYGGGGTHGLSGTTTVFGTLGQSTPTGHDSHPTRDLFAGFWIPGGTATSAPKSRSDRNFLHQNQPNPFNPHTRIDFEIAESGLVEIDVLNLRGGRVRVLVSEYFDRGPHAVEWDGRDHRGVSVATGTYLVRLRIGDFTAVKKMLLVK